MQQRSPIVLVIAMTSLGACASSEIRQSALLSLYNGSGRASVVTRRKVRSLRRLLASRTFLRAVVRDVRRDWRGFFETKDEEREVRRALDLWRAGSDTVRLAAYSPERERARVLCRVALSVLERLSQEQAKTKSPGEPDLVRLEGDFASTRQRLKEAIRKADEAIAARKKAEESLRAAEEALATGRVAPREPPPVDGPEVDAELQKRRDNLSAVEKAAEILRNTMAADNPHRKEAEARLAAAQKAVEERERAVRELAADTRKKETQPLADGVARARESLEAARKTEADERARERELKAAFRQAKRAVADARSRRRDDGDKVARSLPWRVRAVAACGRRARTPAQRTEPPASERQPASPSDETRRRDIPRDNAGDRSPD